jgi:histidyl-tRNA synthetase
MEAISTQPVKGTRDFYPPDLRLRHWLFGQWRAVAAAYGYEEYDACVLESEALYVRKAGDEITGQLYNFLDKGDRRVALRPEMTPSLVRMIMARGAALSLPARWFSIPQCFRYERMQRGRKREHFQWNMDVIGLGTVAAEVELMTAQLDFLRRVGMDDAVTLRVSDRRVLEGFLADLAITGEAFGAVCVIIDKFAKIGREACAAELAGRGIDSRTAGRVLDLMHLQGIDTVAAVVGAGNPGIASLRRLLELAGAAGIADRIVIDCSVVRGLSYYTGTVWELFDITGEMPRAIAGGGRYDRLSTLLGGPMLPMAGFGFGDVVIMELLEARGLLPELARGLDDVVYPLAEEGFAAASALAVRLRATGRTVQVDYSCRRFKHALRAAELAGASRLLVLGPDELARGVVTVRALAGRDERQVPFAEVK